VVYSLTAGKKRKQIRNVNKLFASKQINKTEMNELHMLHNIAIRTVRISGLSGTPDTDQVSQRLGFTATFPFKRRDKSASNLNIV